LMRSFMILPRDASINTRFQLIGVPVLPRPPEFFS